MNRPSTPDARQAPPPARCSAASVATSVAEEAESWMTPPPGPLDRNAAGRSSSSASQSSMTVSTSVQAGPVAQSMPCVPRPAPTRSPSTLGPQVFAGK